MKLDWECDRCGKVYRSNPKKCFNCKGTVFTPVRTVTISGNREKSSASNNIGSKESSINSEKSTRATSSGLSALLYQSLYRLAGKTTFRNPSFSFFERLFALLLYPVAVVGAIVRPVIWLALVTAFSPLASFTPAISTVVEWAIVLSVLFAYAPPSLVAGMPPFLLDYYDLLQGLRPGWSVSIRTAGWRITVTLSTAIA